MTGAPRLMLYVQHLLGIGHLRRATTLARGFAAAGMEVTLVSGGVPVPGLDLAGLGAVQLPPTRAADEHFKRLLDADDRPVDPAWKARRRELLMAAFDRARPDVLLFELFPFGRRQLRFELDPLLAHARRARPRPLVVSSMRDILVPPSKAGRVEEIVELVVEHFDLVLIHGDPSFIPFDSTFPAVVRIADRVRYTGYVVEPPPAGRPDGAAGRGEVLVSAGSGAVSERIFEAALAARALSRLADAPWRALVGHSLPEARFRRLRRRAPDGIVVERARADFTGLLAACRLSISQGGYNTVMEVLQAGRPCVTVPFAGGIETEQTLRCRLLAERGVLQMVAEDTLSPERLAAAVAAALDGPAANAAGIATDGLKRSTALVQEALDAHRAGGIAVSSPRRQIG